MPVTATDNTSFDPSKYGAVEVVPPEKSSSFDPAKYGAVEVKKKVPSNGLEVGSKGQLQPSVPATSQSNSQENSKPAQEPNFGMASFSDLAKGQRSTSDNTTQTAPQAAIQAKENVTDIPKWNQEKADYKAKVIKNTPTAILNAAIKSLKIKGINPSNTAQLNKEKQHFQNQVEDGNATVGFDKNGTPGLIENPGLFDAFHKHMMDAINENKESRDFKNMNVADRVAFANKKLQEQPSAYIGEKPTELGSVGAMVGGALPTLGLYGAGAAAGGVLETLAPETGGLSNLALKPVMSFVTNAGGEANKSAMNGVLSRYAQIKKTHPEIADEDAMIQAQKGEDVDRLAGIGTAALFSETGGQLGKSVTKNFIKGAIKSGVDVGAKTALVEGGKDIAHNIEGVTNKKASDIAKDMGIAFAENAPMGAALHGLMGVLTGIPKVPAMIKSALKYDVVSKMKPEEINAELEKNVQSGAITPEQAQKAGAELNEFDSTLKTVPSYLSDEAKASATGLIIKRNNLLKENEGLDKTAQDLVKSQTDAIDNQLKEIYRTGKPLQVEINPATGETFEKPTYDDVQKQRVQDLADKISKGKKIEDAEDLQAEQQFPEELKKELTKIQKSETPKEEETQSDAFKNVNKYLEKNKAIEVQQPAETKSDANTSTSETTLPTTENKTKEPVIPSQVEGKIAKSESVIPKDNEPFQFTYLRNKEKAPNMGERFGQHIEPSGKYVVVSDGKFAEGKKNFETGDMRFDKPLVIDFGGGYGEESNWKNVLSKRYDGKTGKALSEAIKKDGYDGIVTISESRGKPYTSEIVALNPKEVKKVEPIIKQKVEENKPTISKDNEETITNNQKNKDNEISNGSSIQKEQENTSGQSTGGTQAEENKQSREEIDGENKGEEKGNLVHSEYPPTSLSYMGTGKLETEFGVNERESTSTKHDIEAIKEADNLLEKGWSVKGLLNKIEEGDAHISDAEYINLTRYGAELSDRLRRLKNDIDSPEYNKTLAELNRVANASNLSGQSQGRALGIRSRFKTVSDGTYADYMLTEMDANNGAPLTPAQKEIANKQYTDFEKAMAKFEEDKAKFDEEVSKFNAEKKINETKKSSPKKSRKTHEDFVKERKDIFDHAREQLKKARGETSSTIIPYAKELIAIAPDVAKMVRSLAEEGVYKLEDVVKTIHDQFKDEIPQLQKKDIHDIIAGEYNEKKITKKEAAIHAENLRIEAQLLNKLDKLQSGEIPKNDKAKIKRNQEIEELRNKIKEVIKELPKDESALKSLIKRNEKETAAIKEKIANKDYAIEEKKAPLLDDKELQKRFPETFKAAQKSRDELIKVKHDISVRRLKQMYENKTPSEKTIEVFSKTLNIPRTLMASMDFSAPLRQAVIATTAHPKLANGALKFMFKAAADEKVYNRWLDDVHNSPRWQVAEKIKLAITDPESLHVKQREEAFQGAPYAEKIPIIGAGVAASERAYVGYLNKLRWDIFNMYADRFEEQGKTFDNNKKLYEGLSSMINSATGRGNMKGLENAAPVLNWFLFASRLIASRLNMMGLSDIPNLAIRGATLGKYGLDYGFYSKLPPELRIEAAKDMAKFIAVGISTLLLAKAMSNLTDGNIEIELDPRSSDFGKIKSGNTRWDIWGGFQPYARVLTQSIMAERKATTTGKIYDLNGKGFMGETRLSPLASFARGKLSPVISTGINLASGRDVVGQPVTLGQEGLSAITPLIINDVYQGVKDQGVRALFTVGVPSAFGIGVQTFQPKVAKEKGRGSSRSSKRSSERKTTR